jgi:cysteine synthase
MLMRASEAGHINETTERIVEYSSGNTAISLGIVSNIMGGPQVGAYISNKTSSQKMELLRFFVSTSFNIIYAKRLNYLY